MAELEELLAAARARDAVAVTTAKDWVRLPTAWRVKFEILEIAVEWREAGRLEALLRPLLTPAPKVSADG